MVASIDRAANGGYVLLDGETGYLTGRAGARWYVSNPTVNTSVTAQTAFAATTPFLLFDTDASTRMIPNSILIGQTGTVAGGTLTLIFYLDSKNRFGSGGTQLTPKQTAMELSGTSGITAAYVSPTANTASGNVRYFAPIIIPADTTLQTQILLGDAYSVGASSSFGLFLFASTTGPSVFYNVEWIEERSSA